MTEHANLHIVGAGAYAPRFRLPAASVEAVWDGFEPAGIDATAVPGADEDALTLAAAAGRRALVASETPPESLEYLGLATTTPPLEEGEVVARLAHMLGATDAIETDTATGSPRAGTRVLTAALDRAPAVGLVIAADCPQGEPHMAVGQAAGAGAAAFVLARGGGQGADNPSDDPSRAIARVTDRSTYLTPYPGTRFRRRGADRVEEISITEYDREAYRSAVTGAVDGMPVDPDIAAVALQAPTGALPYRVADAIGVDTDAIAAYETVSSLGDTAAASVPLSLARALADGADCLAVGYGGGSGADALLVEANGPVPSRLDLALGGGEPIDYGFALRLRGEITADEPSGGGAYVSLPSWRRSLPSRHRLIAGSCSACGTLTFPPGGACRDCGHSDTTDTVALPGTGTVEAVTTIARGGAPPEFVPQQSRGGDFAVAIVRFDGPTAGDIEDSASNDGDEAGVSVPLQVTDGHDVAVGDRVWATIRHLYTQEGVPRYACKVIPTAAADPVPLVVE